MRHLKYSSISIWNETQYKYKDYIVVTTTQPLQTTVRDSQSSPDVFRSHRPTVSAHRCLEDPTLDPCVKALSRATPDRVSYLSAKQTPYSHFPKLCIQVFIGAGRYGAIYCIHLKHNSLLCDCEKHNTLFSVDNNFFSTYPICYQKTILLEDLTSPIENTLTDV